MLSYCENNINNKPYEKAVIEKVDKEKDSITNIQVTDNFSLNNSQNLDNKQSNDEKSISNQLDDSSIFSGEWHRTNVESDSTATITISNSTENGFDFYVSAFFFSHSGIFEGKVKTIDGEGVTYIKDEWSTDYNYRENNKSFIFKDNKLIVESENNLPVGMNVTIDGEYTKDEPIYTNKVFLKR